MAASKNKDASLESKETHFNADLHKVVSEANNASSGDSKSTQHLAPIGVVELGLANAQSDQVVHKASTKDPVAACRKTCESGTGDDLNGGGGENILVVCNTKVVDEVEDTNTSEGLSVDVGEDGRGGGRVHRAELGEDEVKLAEGVDDDKYVGELESLRIPRKHPRFFSGSASCHVKRRVVPLTANANVP